MKAAVWSIALILLLAACAMGVAGAEPGGSVVGPGGALAPFSTSDGVTFSFYAPGSGVVYIAGDFNDWAPAVDAMTDTGDGIWQITLKLQPGEHQYKFVVEGSDWHEDPNNPESIPDPYGGKNSIVKVLPDGSLDKSGWGGTAVKVEPVVETLTGHARPIYLAILWHQHQPRYFKDPATGEYLEPWVRIHAVKDYYDMVAILADYPELKFTVDLTPVLLSQLEEMVAGYQAWKRAGSKGFMPGCDKWMRLTLTPPAELTRDDKVFILQNFFRMPWETMVQIYPRFAELAAKKPGDSPGELDAGISNFTDADWRDLQAWFNLAEFDPDFKEGDVTLPDGEVVSVKHLIEKGRDFTERDKAEIIESQMKIMANVIPVHKDFAAKGQLEIITCPFYHPILPLLCDTDIAKTADPMLTLPEERFSHPEDARAQIVLARDYHRKLFGSDPKGMWPSEGSVSEAMLPLVADAGIHWLATDEEVLAKSLGVAKLSAAQKYRMYYAGEGDSRVAMIFRDHRLSDDIGFQYSKMNGTEAANDMIRKLYSVHEAIQSLDGDYVVPIIMDGENAWEHFENDGKEFFHSFYSQVEEAPWIVPVTISDFLELSPPEITLGKLAPGSWIMPNFDTWIGEGEENTAWDYLKLARDHIEANRASLPEKVLKQVLNEAYIAEGSDWFWWYGLDQNSGNDEAFDEAFRGTLSRIYTLSGKEPPDYLSLPIVAVEGSEPTRSITQAISPTIDGKLTAPGEWDGAAYVGDAEGGAMQRAGGDVLKGFHYGYDGVNLYLRLDTDVASARQNDCSFSVYFSGPSDIGTNIEVESSSGESRSFGFGVSTRVDITFDGAKMSAAIADADGKGGWLTPAAAYAVGGEFVEVQVPFVSLGMKTGSTLKLAAAAYCGGLEADVVPERGFLAFKVPPLGKVTAIASFDDPAGDDHGPGYYTYPTDGVFTAAAFDMTSLEVTRDAEDVLIFKIGLGAKPTSPWGGITGYSLQAIDIYIDTDGKPGSGSTEFFTARKARTVPEHAWEYYLRASMDVVALYDTGWNTFDKVKVESYGDEASSAIYVRLPRSAIEGGKTWNVIVAMLGHDGYGEGGIRAVTRTAEQWTFGGCDNEGLCPAIIDLVVGEGMSQEEMLSAYRKTGELVEIRGVKITLP